MNSAPLSIRRRACGINPRRAQQQLECIAEDHLVRGQKTIEAKLPDHTKSTYAIAFSACGKYCATSTGDHNVHVIERATGKLVKTLTGHPRTCWSVVFHPKNPKLIASADLSGEVRVWCVDTGEGPVWRRVRGVVERETNSEFIENIENIPPPDEEEQGVSVCFHPRDNVLAIGISNELHLWDWWEDFKPFVSLKTGSDAEKILFCRFSPDGKQLITAISSAPETASPQPPDPFQEIITHADPIVLTRENTRAQFSAMENTSQQPSTSTNVDETNMRQTSRTRDTSPLRVTSPRNSRISPFHRRHHRTNQNQNPLGQQPFSLTVPGANVAPGDWGASVPPASITYGHLEDLTSDMQDRAIPGTIYPLGNSRAIPLLRPNYVTSGDDGVSIEQLIGSRTLQRAFVRDFAMHLQYDRHRPREEKKKLCRLQLWDFDPQNLPEISLPNVGHLLSRVKLNNDSSVSIAKDFSQIACFVQEQSGREHHYSSIFSKLTLVVISLRPNNLGDTLWSRNFGNDALCVSISPMNNYLAIGMKVRRMSFPPRNVPLIEFYSMNDSTRAVSTMTADLSSNFSSRNQQFVVNTIAFMPTPGQGLLYGTSTGKLCLVVPDSAKENSSETEDPLSERERQEQRAESRDNLRARLRSAQRQASIRNTTSYLRLGENTVSVTPAYSSTRSRAISVMNRLDTARGILRRTTQDPLLSSGSITEYRPVTVQLQSGQNGEIGIIRRDVSPTLLNPPSRSSSERNAILNRNAPAQFSSPLSQRRRTRRRSAASSRSSSAPQRSRRRADVPTNIADYSAYIEQIRLESVARVAAARQEARLAAEARRDASTNTDSSSAEPSRTSRASTSTSSQQPTRSSARLRERRTSPTTQAQTRRQLMENLRRNAESSGTQQLDIQALQRDLIEQRAQLARQHAILVEHQRMNSRLRRRVVHQERLDELMRITDDARNSLTSLEPVPLFAEDVGLNVNPAHSPPTTLTPQTIAPFPREENSGPAPPATIAQSTDQAAGAHLLDPNVHMRLLEIENALNNPTSSSPTNPSEPPHSDR